MVNLTLPVGAKDLLPLDVAQKLWIESRLQTVFQSWGYHCIITPTLERLEALTAGGAVKSESVIQIGGGSETLGLRPELTASIARAYASRLGKIVSPQRLYYNSNVFRQVPANGLGQQEYYQAGVELLGGSGLVADGEILLLLIDCLKSIELTNWQMVLGDAALTSSLLNSFPSNCRAKIRKGLAELDRVGLLGLAIPEVVRSQALELLDLRGNPHEVLVKMQSLTWATDLEPEINHLKSLIELLDSVNLAELVVLDLSLIQTFDYYTGIVFEIVSNNQVVAQGGRYDQLLGVYHPQGVTHPSVGFGINLETLQKVLLSTLPSSTKATDWLVVPMSIESTKAAFAYASELRAKPETSVEIQLDYSSGDRALIVAYAEARNIKKIALIYDLQESEILSLS